MAVANGTYPPRVEPNGKRRDKNLLSEPNAKRNATKQIPLHHASDGAELSMILQMMTFNIITLPITIWPHPLITVMDSLQSQSLHIKLPLP